MPNDFLPKTDAQLQVWLNNFTTVASANLAALGLTAAQVTVITNDTTAFAGSLTAVKQTKEALRGYVQGKETNRKKAVADVRSLVRAIQGNPNVSPSLKANLGLNPRTTHTVLVTPVAPSYLTVEGFSNGVNRLDWKSGGNHPGTIYLVEAAVGSATHFVLVAAVTATRYDHEDVTPGQKITYRLRARRRKSISAPSQSVTLYGGVTAEETPALQLSKAA